MDNKKNIDYCVKIMNIIHKIEAGIKFYSSLFGIVLLVFVMSYLISFLSILLSGNISQIFGIDNSSELINLSITSTLVAVTSLIVLLTYANLKETQAVVKQSKTERVLDNIEKILMNVYSPIDTVLKRYKLSLEYYQSGDSKKIPDNFNRNFLEMNDELLKIQTNYGYLFEPDLILFYNNAWKVWKQYLGSKDNEKKKMLFEQLNGDINILHDFITQQINVEKKKKNEII